MENKLQAPILTGETPAIMGALIITRDTAPIVTITNLTLAAFIMDIDAILGSLIITRGTAPMVPVTILTLATIIKENIILTLGTIIKENIALMGIPKGIAAFLATDLTTVALGFAGATGDLFTKGFSQNKYYFFIDFLP